MAIGPLAPTKPLVEILHLAIEFERQAMASNQAWLEVPWTGGQLFGSGAPALLLGDGLAPKRFPSTILILR